MAKTVNLNLDQGTDTVFQFELVDSDLSPMELTGFRAESQFKKTLASETEYSFTTEIPDPKSDGFVHCTITSDSSNDLKPGRYFYDLEIIDSSSGITERVAEGILEITPGITKSAQ